MTLPSENLDDKTFEELVKEAVSRIPVYAPEWTDYNVHDPGITFIELFAWLVEMQIYRLNRVTGESYRKFLTLVRIRDNTKAASGEEEAEKLEKAKIRARKDLKTVYRAVTSADYEHIAKSTPGLRVARAKAIPRYHPSQGDSEVPGVVTVVVVPDSSSANIKPEQSASLLKSVYRHLDKHRLLTTELFVMLPAYVDVSVKATVAIKPKSEPSRVKKDVEKELKKFLHPTEEYGARKGWRFGRPVYRSEIYELIDGVDGVDYVTGLKLKREGEAQPGDILIPRHGLVSHSIPSVITIEKGASHG